MPEVPPSPAYDGGSATSVAVAEHLLARPPMLAATRMLALDGPAGSGKTSLAHAVATVLSQRGNSVHILSLDDMYEGWTGLNPALETRVVQQVLQPLRRGKTAHWQAYDWQSGALRDWRDLTAKDVLVLEGCGAGARRYAPYTTLLVWVEAAAAVRVERAVARDGPQVLEHWADWAAAETRSFGTNDTRSRAELVVRT